MCGMPSTSAAAGAPSSRLSWMTRSGLRSANIGRRSRARRTAAAPKKNSADSAISCSGARSPNWVGPPSSAMLVAAAA